MAPLTLQQLCALTPPLCRLTAIPAVYHLLENGGATPICTLPLAQLMAKHPRDTGEVLAILGCPGDLSPEDAAREMSRLMDAQLLSFVHICRQCTAGELLETLCRLTVAPTMDGLALLVANQREKEARQLYQLQLLWRICGDEALTDPIALFRRRPPAASTLEDVRHRLLEQLRKQKGGPHHG